MLPKHPSISNLAWRKGWDSNPRYAFTYAGFQDRSRKPLEYPSNDSDRLTLGLQVLKSLGPRILFLEGFIRFSCGRRTRTADLELMRLASYQLLPSRYVWSLLRDLNPRPADYKSAALPAELRRQKGDLEPWSYAT